MPRSSTDSLIYNRLSPSSSTKASSSRFSIHTDCCTRLCTGERGSAHSQSGLALKSALFVNRSADNIAEGLNFFVTTIEMLLIAVFQLYAFPVSEYRIVELHDPAAPRVALGPTSFWRSFSHSQNYADFFVDVYLALRFYVDSLRGKEYTRRNKEFEDDRKLLGGNDLDLETAFFGGMPDAPTGLPTRSHHPHGGGDKDVSDLADRNALAGVSSRASSRRASVDGVGLPTLAYRGRTPSVDIGGDEDAEKVWADARRVNEGEKK